MTENTAPNPVATQPATGILTFDGVDYPIDKISEEARNQLANVRVTDQEIVRLRQQTAMVQTARGAYVQALKNALQKA